MYDGDLDGRVEKGITNGGCSSGGFGCYSFSLWEKVGMRADGRYCTAA
jgi:hypothetical protein